MRLPALGARRRTPAHAPSRTPLRARAHIRPPLSEVSQVSQPSRGARNALKTKCAFGGTRSVTRCAAVTPPRPSCRGGKGQPRARPTNQYPPPCVGPPAPVPAGAPLGACAYTRARAGKRKARRRHWVYTSEARHVHSGVTGLLPVATGIGFFPARVRRCRTSQRGTVPQEGRNARKSQKNGQCGQMAAHAARRTSRTGANGACRPRRTRDTCARARHAPRKKRATIWRLAALCLSLLYINQQPQGAAARRWIAGTRRPLLLYRPAAGVRSAERY